MQFAFGARGLMWVGVAVGLAACNAKGGRTDYSKSPDSGAVAPAMKQDTSLTRTYPESTAGGPGRTGKPGVAGDTLSTRGQPVGTRGRASDTANKAKPRP
ncbi:MAG TPA: hypothetical protein VL308_18275 [Gemmatimonadaceae bacterium]|jgi:hypothetical protein|nr:hypothetical protein [Gemmatimonadaceae bacterium]